VTSTGAEATHRIVVIGGGIARIVTATHLSRALRRSELADVPLVNHNRAYVWKPVLHTFSAGATNYNNENLRFISHAKLNGFKYWPGGLRGLDRCRKAAGPVAGTATANSTNAVAAC
jgi:NADH:ubiquinone reductase (H+-translocating)